jgi:hypothetical protein
MVAEENVEEEENVGEEDYQTERLHCFCKSYFLSATQNGADQRGRHEEAQQTCGCDKFIFLKWDYRVPVL